MQAEAPALLHFLFITDKTTSAKKALINELKQRDIKKLKFYQSKIK